MNKNIKNYFLGANSCSGYVSFLPEHLSLCDRIIVLKNASGIVKRDIFDKIINKLNSQNTPVEEAMAAGSSQTPYALFIPSAKTAVIDGSHPVRLDTGALKGSVSVCDFSECFENEKLHSASKQIISLTSEETENKQKLFEHLSKAKAIHDDWEKIYIANMDFEKMGIIAESLIGEIFKNTNSDRKAVNVNRFFGSMLPEGSVNYINNLTEGLDKRIFIKGRPGTGKSTLLKKIKNAAAEHGFDTETYYCSFDTKSLDMVIIRGLSLCIFDSTAPHEMFPELPGDSILDVYELAVTDGTDEKYKNELDKITDSYNNEMNSAKQYLKQAALLRSELEKIYTENTNEKKCEEFKARIASSVCV